MIFFKYQHNTSALKSKDEEYEQFLQWSNKVESILLQPLKKSPRSQKDASFDMKESESKAESKAAGISFGLATPVFTTLEPLSIGDVVKVRECGMMYEGIIIEIIGNKVARVDFGDDIGQFPLEHCLLVLNALEYEVGDHVQVQPEGETLFFSGVVIGINHDHTLDVQMDGDDEDDVERNVPISRVVKKKSSRPLASGLWKKIKQSIHATHMFRESAQKRICRSFSEAVKDEPEEFDIRRQRSDG